MAGEIGVSLGVIRGVRETACFCNMLVIFVMY